LEHPSHRFELRAPDVAGAVKVTWQSGHMTTFDASIDPEPASSSPIWAFGKSSTLTTGMPYRRAFAALPDRDWTSAASSMPGRRAPPDDLIRGQTAQESDFSGVVEPAPQHPARHADDTTHPVFAPLGHRSS
jgi:hypothetical protein